MIDDELNIPEETNDPFTTEEGKHLLDITRQYLDSLSAEAAINPDSKQKAQKVSTYLTQFAQKAGGEVLEIEDDPAFMMGGADVIVPRIALMGEEKLRFIEMMMTCDSFEIDVSDDNRLLIAVGVDDVYTPIPKKREETQ
jgi:hypothetical protein